MRFVNGLPCDNGSTDCQDSSRLAGLCAVFNYSQPIDITRYVVSSGKYCRHPSEYNYPFSRDQASCLFAGLYFKGFSYLVDAGYIPENGDIINPSVRGHFKRCAGKKENWFEKMFFYADIFYHCKVKWNDESNQILCMLMVAGPEYVRFYKKHNKQWRDSIISYWCGWRDERDLAAAMILKLSDI